MHAYVHKVKYCKQMITHFYETLLVHYCICVSTDTGAIGDCGGAASLALGQQLGEVRVQRPGSQLF